MYLDALFLKKKTVFMYGLATVYVYRGKKNGSFDSKINTHTLNE